MGRLIAAKKVIWRFHDNIPVFQGEKSVGLSVRVAMHARFMDGFIRLMQTERQASGEGFSE